MREFAFEVALCASLERDERLVSRQLGAHVHGRRVVDTILLTPGPEFDERVTITPETIPDAAIEAEVGTGRAVYWGSAFDGHPDHARAQMERAVDVGFLESERRNGRTYVRQVARYPDWVDEIVAIENKPDLDRPGDLEAQLRTDVSLALADKVVLATASHVTGAHRNRIPDEVGIWRFDPDAEPDERSHTVLREPERLPVDEAGVERIERRRGRTDVRIVSAAEKDRARRRLAERAYGKGWRTYDLPACERCEPDDAGLPHCTWKGRPVRASDECGSGCEGHEPTEAPPAADATNLRADRSPWDPDPPGRTRRQSGLDRF